MIPKNELQQMYYIEDMSMQEIALEIGVSRSTVYYWMQKHAIVLRTYSKLLSIDQKKELMHMYWDKSMSLNEIAKEICVPCDTVYYWMKKYGIRMRTNSESLLIKTCMPSKEELDKLYWSQRMSISQIAELVGVSLLTVRSWMKKYGIETRTNSEARIGRCMGKNNGAWNGGSSFKPYCSKFNRVFKEAVRKRDGYICQLCGCDQNGRKLDVHHIHYDKLDCWPDVVALCHSCHAKVNTDRDYWEQHFENHLFKRGLACWSILQE